MRRQQDLSRRRGHNGKPEAASELPGRFEREFPLYRVLRDDGTADPAEVLLPDEEILELYRWMVLNRELDHRMVTLQRQGRIGFYIGSVGEEATVFGAASAMEERDWIFPCYREHGAALFRGMPLRLFLCGLFGNAGDPLLGHQMPCHEAWRLGRYLSVSAPIATQIPHAAGAAWAARIRKDGTVILTYFGDGATSANDFHTGLNFAGVRKAPVIFLCRNNGWAISLPRERQTAAETIAQKGLAYGIGSERVDGNDVFAVHNAVKRARARAAEGQGPTLLEAVTYRLEGHSTSDDPRAYRPPELVEPWTKKDPIRRLEAFLLHRGLLAEEEAKRILAAAREEIRQALEEAESFEAKPPVETLFRGVYAEPLWQQREQLEELRAAIDSDERVAGGRGGQ